MALRRLLVLLGIGQQVALPIIELHWRRRLLWRELPLILITSVGDLAEIHIGRLPDGWFVNLEVRCLLEFEHVGDDVGWHRLDLGVVNPDIGVVEATASGDPILCLG